MMKGEGPIYNFISSFVETRLVGIETKKSMVGEGDKGIKD